MRLLLDAYISARRIGQALRSRGHDVRAADEERALDAWSDEELLSLAAAGGRILVTFNVRDFARLSTEWAEAGRSHAGCALLVGLDHREFGLVVRRLEAAFAHRPRQRDWCDRADYIGRRS